MNRKISTNSWVKVKLTEIGKEELQKREEEMKEKLPHLRGIENTMGYEEDENGYSRWQLHQVMQIFGHLCLMDVEGPFCTDILIDAKEVEPVTIDTDISILEHLREIYPQMDTIKGSRHPIACPADYINVVTGRECPVGLSCTECWGRPIKEALTKEELEQPESTQQKMSNRNFHGQVADIAAKTMGLDKDKFQGEIHED